MINGMYSEAIKAGFSPQQAGMLARLGGETKDEIREEQAKKEFPRPSNNFRFFRALLIYSIDIFLAICAWIYGFGLTPQNWLIIIGLGVFSRFFFHVLSTAFIYDDIQAKEKE